MPNRTASPPGTAATCSASRSKVRAANTPPRAAPLPARKKSRLEKGLEPPVTLDMRLISFFSNCITIVQTPAEPCPSTLRTSLRTPPDTTVRIWTTPDPHSLADQTKRRLYIIETRHANCFRILLVRSLFSQMQQFGIYRLDLQNECLWQADKQLKLTPRPFSVLRYLVENPQRLVTHDELLEALWPETYVQPQVLRTYVLELRKVFGDDAGNARFIETVPKRGYRFIAPIAEDSGSASGYEQKNGTSAPSVLVGR